MVLPFPLDTTKMDHLRAPSPGYADSGYGSRRNSRDLFDAADKPYLERGLTSPSPSCIDSAYCSGKDLSESHGMTNTTALACKTEQDNTADKVTKTQQRRALVAAAVALFWVQGVTQSFGIWQRHYGSNAAVKDGILSSADMKHRPLIATVGSLANGGLVAMFSMLWMPYLPKIGGHIKKVCAVGMLLMTAGFGLAATSSKLWVLILTQGLLFGLGGGVLVPMFSAILPEYFGQRSGLAQGISMAAASLGGTGLSLIVPIMLQRIGTRPTLGVMAALSTACGILITIIAVPPRKFERRSTRKVTWKTFRDPVFTLMFITNFLHPLTLANPMAFGPDFSHSLGFSNIHGSMLLAGVSAIGLPGRILSGYVSDRIGHTNMLLLATVIYAISTWALWFSASLATNTALWITFSALYGLVNGTFMTVINSIQKKLFGDELYFPYNGALTSIRGLGYLCGVPIAGALVSRVGDAELNASSFSTPVVYNGALLTIVLGCIISIRVLDAKKKGWIWIR